jgi:regulatory protein
MLERYCIYQDRCHNEVEKKLLSLNIIPEAREVILLNLLKNDFLNEERYAKSFARGKFRIKKWGKIKIINKLKWHYISSYNIKTALLEIDDNEYLELINDLLIKKMATLKDQNSFIKRKKVIDYMLQKGFEFSLVNEAINMLNKKI